MNKLALLIAAIALCPAALFPAATMQAQSPEEASVTAGAPVSVEASPDVVPIRERLYIQTDKDNYLSGELVWMKLLTTTERGLPLAFSKVGYVELVDGSERRVQIKMDIRDGVGSGTLLLPPSLPTGYYRIKGYTRYMQNEGADVFFEKMIGVVNPSNREVVRSAPEEAASGGSTGTSGSGSAGVSGIGLSSSGSSSAAGSGLGSGSGGGFGSSGGGSLTLSGLEPRYGSREAVRMNVSGIPADIHNLSVSVVRTDLTGGVPVSQLGGWHGSLERAPLGRLSGRFEAEYEGHIVTGKLVDTGTGEVVANPSNQIAPIVAFPGDGINLFGGKVDRAGGVVFRTQRTSGSKEIATSMRGNTGEPYRIDVDVPYTSEDITEPVPTFPLDAIDDEAILAQSLAMQLQYAYLNDSLNRIANVTSHYPWKPDKSYLMEEWTKFATMHDVVIEFITSVRFSREDGKRYLAVWDEDYIGSRTFSLVLLDGIPIMDHEIIYNYDPLLLDRIDVYSDIFVIGENVFNGIVAMYTKGYNYPELEPDAFTQVLPYDSPQFHRVFFSPDYSDPVRRASRLPDFRHTLYWNADVDTDLSTDASGSVSEDASRNASGNASASASGNALGRGSASGSGNAAVSFHTSDMKGRYRVIVEGLTASGKTLQATTDIEVE